MSPCAALLVLAGAAAERPTILAIRSERMDARQAVRVVATRDPGEVQIRREGDEVILSLGADAPAALVPPPPAAPIEAIRIGREPAGLAVRVRVAPEVPYELRRDGAVVSVLFGEAEQAPPPPPDVSELYKRIFPPPASAVEDEAGEQVTGLGPGGVERPKERTGGGFGLGPVTLRPSIAVSYVDAKTALLSTPQPVRDHYLEVQPRVGAELSLWTGRFQADYEPKFRRYSSFSPQVERTTHIANASLQLPLGTRVTLGVTEHYTRGLLETNEVDPGGEYFFQLGRFTRNRTGVTARVEIGARLSLDLAGTLNEVRFAERAGFFGYKAREGSAGLGFEVTPSLTAVLSYVYERVPPPEDRPQAESTSHGVQLLLRGEILPMVTGEVAVGYLDQRSPRAASGGERFRGVTASGFVKKEFSRASTLELTMSRSPQISAFEGNAFYVATSGQAQLTVPLPLAFSLRGGAGYHWNQYQTIAAGVEERRKDRIFGWSAGLGRPITSWAFVRADYRRERRNSNLDVFDTETDALTVQLGVGLFGAAGRP